MGKASKAAAEQTRGPRVAAVDSLPPEFLDVAGASRFTGIPASTLNTLRCRDRHKGPAYVKVGRSVRYPVAGLREWMQKHLRNADEG